MSTSFDEMADAFVQIGEQIERHYARKISRIQRPEQLLRLLHRAWYRVVRDSAIHTRGAPAHQIVTQGYDIGWKIWGNRDKSRIRYNARIRLFRPIYDRLVQRWLDQITTEPVQ